MRLIPPLLALLLAASAALADPPTVNEFTRTVNTGSLRVRFDELNPDRLASVELLPLGDDNLAGGDLGEGAEFFGQTLRARVSPGFTDQDLFVGLNWLVWTSSDSDVVIRTETWSDGQPPVRTDWTFRTNSALVGVERTVFFSLVPDSASYQPFVVRMAPVTTYRALRWRDAQGSLRSGLFCWDPCVDSSWDGRWVQFYARRGDEGYSVALAPASSNPGTGALVRGVGVLSYSAAFGLLRPAELHDRDETHRYVMAFSTSALADTAVLDSLQAKLDATLPPLAAPIPPRRPGVTLGASPNPARGDVRLAWTMPTAGEATLVVLDVTGRRVASLARGSHAAGEQRVHWRPGADVPPGVYLAVLRTPGGVTTRRIARVR